jgi:hypothetical protein
MRTSFALVFLIAVSAVAADPKIAPDESFTIAEFARRGAPAPDHQWGADEYQRLVKTLQPIAESSPRRLPRFDSRFSGAMMSRVIAQENFGTLHDKTIDLKQRVAQGMALAQAGAQLAGVYITGTNKGESFDRELVELMGWLMRVNLELWSLADELLTRMTPEQRARPNKGLDTMREGSAQMVDGVLTSLTETDIYRQRELRRLATLITPTLPKVMQRLPPQSAAEARARLRRLVAEVPDKELAQQIRMLITTVDHP